MGCFSFLCKKSGKPALSSSFNGSPCRLFLLKDGKVIEEMHGNYNSYGAVFKKELRTDVKHELHDSFEWKMEWGNICDLMFRKNPGDGIAMILDSHWDGNPPTEKSEQDPDQGWGEDLEGMGDVSSDGHKWVEEPYHKVY